MNGTLQCSKCFKKVQRVYVQNAEKPITDVFFCDEHGIFTMNGMELWEE